jgi:hypothetical protein
MCFVPLHTALLGNAPQSPSLAGAAVGRAQSHKFLNPKLSTSITKEISREEYTDNAERNTGAVAPRLF